MAKTRSGGSGGSRSGSRGGGSGRTSSGKGSSGKGSKSGSGSKKSSPTKRIVQKRPDGNWEAVAPKAKRASTVKPTQAEAEARAKEIVGNAGGGEVIIKGRDNKIRDSDTVPPGNDPNPPKDRKH